MDIHDRRATRKLEKKAVALEKIRSEATKVLKFHIFISCGYFGISTLDSHLASRMDAPRQCA
jgi:hypothetical protein